MCVSYCSRTDISTDDTDEKNQRTLRRLAQNREAARKSRLRKKAYVQQLESLKLTQLEQELQQARQQGIFISSSGDQAHANGDNGAMTFDVEYARWLEEQNRQINELRIKSSAAKNDVFHLLSGMWKTPAERCFMWLGGFRPSELLKLLVNQLEPLTEQQLVGIGNLKQSSKQAEDALSQDGHGHGHGEARNPRWFHPSDGQPATANAAANAPYTDNKAVGTEPQSASGYT
ncbi:hypothetical protein MLD38_038219 [Melastoma candidum]|uniref:Uncharacterized protein n=1 Tax=Melastoma candidum TaxID=119954 RepID=A0ACB9KZP1_9MYRT|nr:hypothetical protein MLD38_038219 [Melastoma candidum]